jgi:hypothetical protein
VLRNLSHKNNVDDEFTDLIIAFDVIPNTSGGWFYTVHENRDMMVQYRVGLEDVADIITNNPITAAPALGDTGLT